MAHMIVELAATCLVETARGLVLRHRAKLARVVDEWARQPDAKDAIAELVRFAIYVEERWGSTEAARALLDIACRATPQLSGAVQREEITRIERGFNYRLAHTAPMYDAPPVHG